MTTEIWVVLGLVTLSVIGLFWNKIIRYILELPDTPAKDPDAYQKRMDLVNQLLKECEDCEEEKKAVVSAGDVIAKHWRACKATAKGGRSK